jgi:hypothetical protein
MADIDILIGPGRVYYAPLATTNPSNTTVVYGAAWGGAWVDLGDFLEGSGVAVPFEEEFTKVYTEQSTAPVQAVRTKREVMIRVTLAEHSGVNMALVLGGTKTDTAAGGSQKAVSSIPIGSQSAINFYKWGIEGFRKDSTGVNQPVRYFFHKGFLRLAGDINFSKADPTGILVEITLLADRSQSAGSELGLWEQVTGPVTT